MQNCGERGPSINMPSCKTSLILPVAIAVALTAARSVRAQEYVRDSEPKLFSYDELVQLSLDQEMSPELAEKLRVITTTPFINNEAYLSGARKAAGRSCAGAFAARGVMEH